MCDALEVGALAPKLLVIINLLRFNVGILHRMELDNEHVECRIVVEEQQRRARKQAEEMKQLEDGQVRFTYLLSSSHFKV